MGRCVLKVSEVAEALGISSSTLRRWETYLDLEIPRDEGGDRFYDEEWLAYFERVKELVDQDKEYDEIKKLLTPPQIDPPAAPPNQDAIEELQKQMLNLTEEIVAVEKKSKSLEKKLKGLSDKDKDLISEVTTLSQMVEGLPEKIETLQKGQTEVMTTLSALQDEVKALSEAPPGQNAGNFWKYATIIFFVIMALGLISKVINP